MLRFLACKVLTSANCFEAGACQAFTSCGERAFGRSALLVTGLPDARVAEMWKPLLVLALGSIVTLGSSSVGEDLMALSIKVTEANWAEAPNYSFVRSETTGSNATEKTYEVLMIEGSPFSKLIRIQGRELSTAQTREEDQKFRKEISRRSNESPHERERRIETYNEHRSRDHALLSELRNAFDYQVCGERSIDGREVIGLHGTPRAQYIPKSREARVLSGMEVTFWIDQRSFQWRRVEAEIKVPVSVYGMLGRVNPGTRFILDQEPISSNLWLPKRFQVEVRATALGFISQSSSREEVYSDYRRSEEQALRSSVLRETKNSRDSIK